MFSATFHQTDRLAQNIEDPEVGSCRLSRVLTTTPVEFNPLSSRSLRNDRTSFVSILVACSHKSNYISLSRFFPPCSVSEISNVLKLVVDNNLVELAASILLILKLLVNFSEFALFAELLTDVHRNFTSLSS